MSVNAILQGQQKPITGDTKTTLDGILMGDGSTVSVKTVDSVPTASSTNLVTSGGVKDAIDDLEDGTIPVALAENLTSDSAQSSAETFIERTTGGTASLSDGMGWLQLIRGNHIHTGYTAGSADMTVTSATHTLSATVNTETFLAQMSSNSGRFVLTYTTSWDYNPATYGVTVTGTPLSGDYIQIDYNITASIDLSVNSPSSAFTAVVNEEDFLAAISSDSGEITFTYESGGWDTNPASYGITITGTPQEDDSLDVEWLVSKDITTAVVPIVHTILASIDQESFLNEMSSASGTFTFSYTSSWDYNPASYGITVTGTPISGDNISVAYVKEVRGTIVQSNPQSFKSSGWNLYNHENGYARVLKYSDSHNFGIDGTYTSIAFSSTLEGEQTAITVTDGRFDIEEDGYVWVTGGNSTDTQIWMTWSDWTEQANGGTWEAYTESTIDFSSIMEQYFPYGLLEVGGYRDEINFSSGVALNYVARVDYSAANLAEVRSYNVDYEYDENYIYYGLTVPESNSITISNIVNAYDHGVEWFTDTELGVYAQTLYGINLKNKLERDVLTISQQDLSDSDVEQVKQNLKMDGIYLSSNNDLNDYIHTGMYYWSNSVPDHAPISNFGTTGLLVERGGAMAKQTAFRGKTAGIPQDIEYTRYNYNNGTWGNWALQPINSATISIYVDPSTGSSNNIGYLSNAPVDSLATAFTRIPYNYTGIARIYLATGTYPAISFTTRSGVNIQFVAQENATPSIAGGNIYTDNSYIVFGGITFTANLNCAPQNNGLCGVWRITNCTFDGGSLVLNSGTGFVYATTFRNLHASNGLKVALNCVHGFFNIQSVVFENTCDIGIKADSGAIVSCCSITNAATNYPVSSNTGARIFLENADWGGPRRMYVTLSNVSNSNKSFTVKGMTAYHDLVPGSVRFSSPWAVSSVISFTTNANSIVVTGSFLDVTNITAVFEIPFTY